MAPDGVHTCGGRVLTPDIEALIDAVRESKEYYRPTYNNSYYVDMPLWWIVPAIREVREELNASLHESHCLIKAYIYKRTSEGDDETAIRWASFDEDAKWSAIAFALGE